MARHAGYDKEQMLADWKTGKYSVRKLAAKHRVSHGTAHTVVAGVAQDLAPLIDAQVSIKQELANLSGRELDTFNQEVDSRTRHLVFFANAAVKNVQEAMGTKCESQVDFRQRAETILKGKETVLGKDQPTTAVQVNVDNRQPLSIPDDPVQASIAYQSFISG